jgi:hypothetical protein
MLYLLTGLIVFSLWLLHLLSDYRRRRLLYSTWRRLIRWEFWPMAAFYPPVIAFALLLGLRYRSLTLFTLANPGMPHAGIAMMSKSDILKGFQKREEHVAAFTVIAAELSLDERQTRLDHFMQSRSLSYPIVLKPDYGERGVGVGIISSPEEARDYLSGSSETVIAQEYVAGEEFGIFYIRRPSDRRGKVWSITAKLPTFVVGDGGRSLEQLILDDERAVCMARFFLRKFSERLGEIVPAGERFLLAELGTHSRGALFLDAGDRWAEELELAIDEMSQSYPGFFLGRYDIRVDNINTLKRGEGFKVLELNGVLSEPTHMYDPKHSLFYAWKTMFRLWSEIFRIGDENRARGSKPSSIGELIQLVREFRKQDKYEA